MQLNTAAVVPSPEDRAPLRTLLAYATGEGVSTLTINGISNFGILYYTQVLGLRAEYVGLALFSTLIWDALLDPVIGHLSDNTRSRLGGRHPYILLGGLALGGSFYFLWVIPGPFAGPNASFWYLLAINLILRTAYAVFIVPYTALGFAICRSYQDRSRLQSVRFAFNQVVNVLGGALAWTLFFQDRVGPRGARIDGTRIASNYAHMSIALTIAIVIFLGLCVYGTRQYASDNRQIFVVSNNSLHGFLSDFCRVISDRLALYVFAVFAIVSLGAAVVTQAQLLTYVDFMKFTDTEKTVVHGAGMIACALGALLQSNLVTRFDKKQAGYFGIVIGIAGNVALIGIFTGRVLMPGETWIVPAVWPWEGGVSVPVAVISFALFQAMWWCGAGVLAPLAMSMIADIADINYRKTAELKDGSYSAVFSLVTKVAAGGGLLINGWSLEWLGFVSGDAQQSLEVARNIALLTFVSGPVVLLIALPILWKYPVDRVFMADVTSGRPA